MALNKQSIAHLLLRNTEFKIACRHQDGVSMKMDWRLVISFDVHKLMTRAIFHDLKILII